MDEYEPICGPGGMGCLYCTTQCPNCGRDVFETDIVFGETKTCCNYCEYEDEEVDSSSDYDPDDSDDLDEEYDDPGDDLDEYSDEMDELDDY